MKRVFLKLSGNCSPINFHLVSEIKKGSCNLSCNHRHWLQSYSIQFPSLNIPWTKTFLFFSHHRDTLWIPLVVSWIIMLSLSLTLLKPFIWCKALLDNNVSPFSRPLPQATISQSIAIISVIHLRPSSYSVTVEPRLTWLVGTRRNSPDNRKSGSDNREYEY